MTDLSVIVVSYRTPVLLRRCLEQLTRSKTEASLEILVVDNDSGDESVETARSFPGVRVIESGENLGFAGGANRGMREAAGRYMLILNPDVDVHEGSLDTLIRFMDEHPATGIAAPKLLNTDGSLQYSCRRRYTLKTIVLRRTFLGKWFPNASDLRRHLMLDYDHAQPRSVDWVAGAAMMVRREALEDVGPMEERYFLYFEDVDWCTRMQARGWIVHYVPQAVMTHHWQRASLGLTRAARRHIRSGLRFYDRWGGFVYVLRQYRSMWRTVGLVLSDLIAFALALLAAYFFRQQLAFMIDRPMWPLSFYGGFFAGSILVYLAAFYFQALYGSRPLEDRVDLVFRVGKAAAIASVILMAITFIFKMRAFSRVIVMGSWPLVFLFSLFARVAFEKLFIRVQRDRWNLRRVALIGDDPVLERIEETMSAHPELGWDPIRLKWTTDPGVSRSEAIRTLIQRLGSERITEVILTPGVLGAGEGELIVEVAPLRRAGIGVRVVSDFLASLPPRVRLESLRGITWLSLQRPALSSDKPAKRIMDLLLAGFLIVAGAPLFVAHLGLRALLRKKIWEPERARVGRWGEAISLRPLSGDGVIKSYPLLINVLRGRMSLVGPRPLLPEEEIPGGDSWQRVRESHRPGVVGPWTLNPQPTPDEEMRQELRYFDEWSPERDLKLLARIVLRRSGDGTGRGASRPAREKPETEAASSGEAWRAQSKSI